MWRLNRWAGQVIRLLAVSEKEKAHVTSATACYDHALHEWVGVVQAPILWLHCWFGAVRLSVCHLCHVPAGVAAAAAG